MTFIDDLDLFLPSESDAKVATLDGVSVKGYFDQNFAQFNFVGEDIEGRSLTFFLKSSDVGRIGAKRGSVLAISTFYDGYYFHDSQLTYSGSKNYTVVELKPDGDGAFIELVLQLQS